MCSPDFGVVEYIAIASAVASAAAAEQQQESQRSAQHRQTDAALAARADNANQINLERNQQAESATQKVTANDISMREAQSTVVASAGPTGLSVDALLANLAQKGANYNDSVNQNYDRVNQALDNQLQNVNTGTASAVNSTKTPDAVDYLGTALKIGGTAYGAYSKGAGTKVTGVQSMDSGNAFYFKDSSPKNLGLG